MFAVLEMSRFPKRKFWNKIHVQYRNIAKSFTAVDWHKNLKIFRTRNGKIPIIFSRVTAVMRKPWNRIHSTKKGKDKFTPQIASFKW